MNRNAIALRVFTALLSRPEAKVSLYPDIAEQQIRTCFHVADVFLRVARETATDTSAVSVGGWPEDEDIDQFLAAIYERRRQG